MHIEIITQPQPLVDIDEMKIALGESGSDRNTLIAGLILAAQAELDGPKSITGFTVAEQTVAVYFDNFDTDIYLPGITIADPITSVEYLDADGATQLLPESVYALQRGGRLALVAGATWPAVSTKGDGVFATYNLGLTDEDDPRIALMKSAIMMHVKMTLDMADPEIYRRAIISLVSPLHVWTV